MWFLVVSVPRPPDLLVWCGRFDNKRPLLYLIPYVIISAANSCSICHLNGPHLRGPPSTTPPHDNQIRISCCNVLHFPHLCCTCWSFWYSGFFHLEAFTSSSGSLKIKCRSTSCTVPPVFWKWWMRKKEKRISEGFSLHWMCWGQVGDRVDRRRAVLALFQFGPYFDLEPLWRPCFFDEACRYGLAPANSSWQLILSSRHVPGPQRAFSHTAVYAVNWLGLLVWGQEWGCEPQSLTGLWRKEQKMTWVTCWSFDLDPLFAVLGLVFPSKQTFIANTSVKECIIWKALCSILSVIFIYKHLINILKVTFARMIASGQC